MESVKRSIMLLRPGDGPYAHPQSRGMLKLQTATGGLAASLSLTGLPAGKYMLYLFLQDGAAIFAGDITGSNQRRTLPGIRLQSIWGAAIIHSPSLAFCLKSTGLDWKSTMTRFKLLHAPRPASYPESQATTEVEPLNDRIDEVNENPIDEPALIMTESPEQETSPGTDEFIEESYEPEPPESSTSEISMPENLDENETEPCHSCPHAARQEHINPFPSVFPQSEWVKMSYPGPMGWWHYITGHIYSGPQIVAEAVGVPGEYSMVPPVWLEGFGTYLRCVTPDAQGYWLMFQDAETGEVLDMGLSPRDA